MTAVNMINSDTTFAIVSTLAAAIWTGFKSSDWYARLQRERYRRALQVLEAAVEDTYRGYVQSIKDGRADGTLTLEEQGRAREIAKQRAFTLGKTEGLDLLKEIGSEYLDLWIAKLVKRLKGK